jgi:hypothetical protein
VDAVHASQAEILEVVVGKQVIRTTALHPFFVIGRGWTPAAQLRLGDALSTRTGLSVSVDEVRATNISERVYNLRVADYRTYFVGGDEWGFAAWVHNACIPEFHATRPFHVIVRDDSTSSILFMGRISNPLQVTNSVNPSVAEPTGDFDGNFVVDGADFLAWQRGVGRTTGATKFDGDSDADGDVDADDRGHWSAAFGSHYVQAAASSSPAAAPSYDPAQPSKAVASANVLDEAVKLNWTTSDASDHDAESESDSEIPTAEAFAIALSDPGFSLVPVKQMPMRRLAWGDKDVSESRDSEALPDSLEPAFAADADHSLGPVL